MIECENMCVIYCHLSSGILSKGFFSCSQDNGKQTGLEWCERWWMGLFWTAGPLQGIVSQWSVTPLSGVPSHHKQPCRSDHWKRMWTPSHKIPSVMFPRLAPSLSMSLLTDGVIGVNWLVHMKWAKPVKTHLFFHEGRDVFVSRFSTCRLFSFLPYVK